MLVLVAATVMASLLIWLLRLLKRLARPEEVSIHSAWSAWSSHILPGKHVLIVSGKEGSSVELAALVEAQGAKVSTLDLGGLILDSHPTDDALARLSRHGEDQQHMVRYDVVIVDRYFSTFSEEAAKAVFMFLCGSVAASGVLLVQDLAALPADLGAYSLRSLRAGLARLTAWVLVRDEPTSCPPYDVALWLPSDANIESRTLVGSLHEALVIRKLAESPKPVIESLRRLHGDTSMAYCTSSTANRVGGAESTIRYFLCEPDVTGSEKSERLAIGYVAYIERVHLGVRLRLVLMDPVCAKTDRQIVLNAFLTECAALKTRPIFSCIGADWKATLQHFGLHTTMLGAEIGIPLADYTLSKERRRYLRAAPAKGLECRTECVDLQELKDLNAAWVDSKACSAEVLIWTWPPAMPEEDADGNAVRQPSEVRRLFTYQDGRLVGFVCVEPYYRGDGSGEILGYGLNTIRFLPRLSPPWISDFTVATLIQSLQEEGKAKYLAFGLSPFSEITAHAGDLPWLRIATDLMWHANFESIYPVQALARKKTHHCAGQGVRLDDRFVSADPAFAFADTARFLTLLFSASLHRVPEGVVIFARMLAAKGLSRAWRFLRSRIPSTTGLIKKASRACLAKKASKPCLAKKASKACVAKQASFEQAASPDAAREEVAQPKHAAGCPGIAKRPSKVMSHIKKLCSLAEFW